MSKDRLIRQKIYIRKTLIKASDIDKKAIELLEKASTDEIKDIVINTYILTKEEQLGIRQQQMQKHVYQLRSTSKIEIPTDFSNNMGA